MDQTIRRGLRLRCDKGVHEDVHFAAIHFCRWLRSEYEFPIRVVVYLKNKTKIINSQTRETVTATFFAPFDKSAEPYIRVAVGYYSDIIAQNGRLHAIYPIVESIAHEVAHYFQWIDDKDLSENEAEEMAEEILADFQYGPVFTEIVVPRLSENK